MEGLHLWMCDEVKFEKICLSKVIYNLVVNPEKDIMFYDCVLNDL